MHLLFVSDFLTTLMTLAPSIVTVDVSRPGNLDFIAWWYFVLNSLSSVTCKIQKNWSIGFFGWFMVFYATFNNISVISWRSVLIGGGNRSTLGKPQTCCKSLTNFITLCCIEYTSPWTGFELINLVVIGTDCTCSCKSNYHTITTRTAP